MSSAFAELAELEYRLGDWPAARASALESLRASRQAGLDQEVMASLVRLACIEAGLGRSHDCRRHAAQASDLGRAGGSRAIEVQAGEAVGFLELGLDRIDRSIDALERVAELVGDDPGVSSAAATLTTDLAEAYVRRGDLPAAQRSLARTTDGPGFARAPALERTAAMVADAHEYERLFRRALAWSSQAQQPFELARTQLCFGERLYSEGRLGEACSCVTTALGSFEALGARPWAKRARRLVNAWSRPARSRSLRPRHLYSGPVRADLRAGPAEFGCVEADRDYRVGTVSLGLFN